MESFLNSDLKSLLPESIIEKLSHEKLDIPGFSVPGRLGGVICKPEGAA